MAYEGVNEVNPIIPSKLDDLAEKSAQKNGTTAHYIIVNQALKEDLITFLAHKFDRMQEEINLLREEVKTSRQREQQLEKQIASIRASKTNRDYQMPCKEDIYLVRSSVLREVNHDDLLNGTVKSISGAKVNDIKEHIKSLITYPKTLITQVGGNDLDNETVTVDEVVSDYAVLITEAKTKFPNSKLVVAGIPPRHHSSEIQTKVKDYNEAMDKWCKTNGMDFINNEEMFEFKSGEVDKGSYDNDWPDTSCTFDTSSNTAYIRKYEKDHPRHDAE